MDADSVSEVILFTTNDETLRNIAKHDETAGNCHVRLCLAFPWISCFQDIIKMMQVPSGKLRI